ncbi:hypothetical protein R3P38DRAFT_2782525 [Favolaschia claudopus]|uniref:Uncharacterized protein n=1 Tax=Favolaschia claudopus TaxID=2862362 RepID=A0AAW0B2M5_9AGAR
MPGLLPPTPPRCTAALLPRHAVSTSRERNFLKFWPPAGKTRPRRVKQQVPPLFTDAWAIAAVTAAPRRYTSTRRIDVPRAGPRLMQPPDFLSSETCSPQVFIKCRVAVDTARRREAAPLLRHDISPSGERKFCSHQTFVIYGKFSLTSVDLGEPPPQLQTSIYRRPLSHVSTPIVSASAERRFQPLLTIRAPGYSDFFLPAARATPSSITPTAVSEIRYFAFPRPRASELIGIQVQVLTVNSFKFTKSAR